MMTSYWKWSFSPKINQFCQYFKTSDLNLRNIVALVYLLISWGSYLFCLLKDSSNSCIYSQTLTINTISCNILIKTHENASKKSYPISILLVCLTALTQILPSYQVIINFCSGLEVNEWPPQGILSQTDLPDPSDLLNLASD